VEKISYLYVNFNKTHIVIIVMPMNTNKNIIFLYTTNSARFVRETAGHTKDMGE
jgi:hypothetical protein